MTTTALKILALVFMFVDHVGQFIPGTPTWFGWIGRISAPLFMFCVIWGLLYTSDKKKYLTRLYLFGVGMAIMNLVINKLYNNAGVYITNNFITTLFLIAFIMFLIQKNEKKLYISFGIWQLVSTPLCIILVEFIEIPSLNDSTPSYMFYGSLFGNILFIEGGILFLVLGVLLYLTRNNKKNLIIYYIIFSILTYLLVSYFGSNHNFGLISYLIPFADYQWMMIAALPFMLIYNRKKGAGLKYFFYIFYPLHIAILYIIGQSLK